MSVEAIGIVLNHSKATGTAKLVLIGIANHEGDGGSWPTINTLARYAGVTPRNVQKAIGVLVELGEVTVQLGAGGTRETPDHMRANRYRIHVKCPRDCDRTSSHRTGSARPGHPLSDATPPVGCDTPSPPVASDTGAPVGSDTSPVSVATPEPSIEPSLEDKPPQTPRQRGAGCARHQTTTPNCRGCGTTNRDAAAAAAADAEARRRAANDAAIQADRAEIARAASAEQRAAAGRTARQLIAASRGRG